MTSTQGAKLLNELSTTSTMGKKPTMESLEDMELFETTLHEVVETTSSNSKKVTKAQYTSTMAVKEMTPEEVEQIEPRPRSKTI